ncbi:MAG: hypothetical protein QM504_03210 [Pseudomonadota bacterium]
MSEIDEILFGKDLNGLRDELQWQLNMGETLGGAICSEIVWRIEAFEASGEEL